MVPVWNGDRSSFGLSKSRITYVYDRRTGSVAIQKLATKDKLTGSRRIQDSGWMNDETQDLQVTISHMDNISDIGVRLKTIEQEMTNFRMSKRKVKND